MVRVGAWENNDKGKAEYKRSYWVKTKMIGERVAKQINTEERGRRLKLKQWYLKIQ